MPSLPTEQIESGARQKRQNSGDGTSTLKILATTKNVKLERNLTISNSTVHNDTLDYFDGKEKEDLLLFLLLSEGTPEIKAEANKTVEITSSPRNTTDSEMQGLIISNGIKTMQKVSSSTTATVTVWHHGIRQKKTTESFIWPLAWLNSPSNERIPLDAFTSATMPVTVTSVSSTLAIESTTTRMVRKLCCPPGGIWGNWSVAGLCDDNCGACGKQYYQRECLSSAWGCPCMCGTAYPRV